MAAEDNIEQLRIDKVFKNTNKNAVAVIAEINRRARVGQLPAEDGRLNIDEFVTIQHGSKNVNLGMTTLQLAASCNRWSVVQHYVSEYLAIAAEQNDGATKSCKNVLDKQAVKKGVEGYTLLMFALEGLCKLVGKITKHADWATYQQDLLDCKLLITTLVATGRVDINITSEQSSGRHHPLHRAAQAGFPDIVELLLSHGAEPLFSNASGQTPMQVVQTKLDDAHPNHQHLVEILGKFTEAQKPDNRYQRANRKQVDQLVATRKRLQREASATPQKPSPSDVKPQPQPVVKVDNVGSQPSASSPTADSSIAAALVQHTVTATATTTTTTTTANNPVAREPGTGDAEDAPLLAPSAGSANGDGTATAAVNNDTGGGCCNIL